jgi:hypothetical protein
MRRPLEADGVTFSLAPRWPLVGLILTALARPVLAGPPYLTDDPEPTPYQHFEIYAFSNGTSTRNGIGGAGGIDFNYGGAPDLQLTATLPIGFDRSTGGKTNVGLSNIELAAKYRFLHQDDVGLDVAVFPRVFLPSASRAIGENHPSLLLPIWLQRDWGGGWSSFGGGGCVVHERSAQNFCLAGGVVTRQIFPDWQLGVELFHQTADSNGTRASSSVGIGSIYDLSETYHLLTYVNRGFQNAKETDEYSWYASLLFTF